VFHRPKPRIPSETKPLSVLTPILSAEQLLAEPKRQRMLQAIAETSQFEKTHYEHIATNLIHQVAYHCQRIPEGSFYFSGPGGLLDHALSRTEAATKLLREYLLPPPSSRLSDDQQRWWYTLFSASVLRGIGTLCVEHHIDRYSVQGQFLKPWDPLFENIGQVNHHYLHDFTTREDPAMKRRLTLLMARKLMPEQGLEWIAENKDIFSVWLALLDEDGEGARALGAILDRADSIVIQQELNELFLKNQSVKRTNAGISSFVDPAINEIQAGKEHAAGLEFLQWLQNKIEAGHFLLNRAPIFVVPGGILICVEAFHLFSKEHVHYKNWHAVQHSFLSLHIHRVGIQGTAINKYEQGEGLVTKNSIILPEIVSLKHAKTGDVHKTTATALAIGETGMHISIKGDWILESTPPQPFLQPKPGTPYGA
jgi:integrating conjugative element relaxase (TIGR03760 family)